jgi:uncharacterized membrane protein YfhO
VTLLEDGRQRLVVRTRAGSDAVLVVADSEAPGWRARVDGETVPILPAWGLVRAVRLPAGEHLVEMDYVPPGFRAGLVLALVGLIALLLGLRRD